MLALPPPLHWPARGYMPTGAAAGRGQLSASATVEVTKDLLNVVLSTNKEGQDAATCRPAQAGARRSAGRSAQGRQAGSRSRCRRATSRSTRVMRPRAGGPVGRAGRAGDRGAKDTRHRPLTGRITTMSVARVSQGVSRELRERSRAISPRRPSRASAPRRPTTRSSSATGLRDPRGQRHRRHRAAGLRAMPMVRPVTAMASVAGRGLAGRGRQGAAGGERERFGSAQKIARHWAVQPPSTAQACPRTLSAPAEQRNTARSPSCSGVVNCSEGCFSPAGGAWLRVVDAVLGGRASTCFCTSGVSTSRGRWR